jgi:transcription antitermination factor NusG
MAAQASGEYDDTRGSRARQKTRQRLRDALPLGSSIQIAEGPLARFGGVVAGITAKGLVDVLIEVFGRLTPARLEVSQIAGMQHWKEAA